MHYFCINKVPFDKDTFFQFFKLASGFSITKFNYDKNLTLSKRKKKCTQLILVIKLFVPVF